MNVVTSNESKNIIDRLDIDIIKRIDGQFELNELLSKFVNLYFNKMIIDITSIQNYTDINVIKQLASAVDPSRVILLLNNDPIVNGQLYISNLINCGFYNFTRNFEGIKFLYNTPNTFENVRHLVLSEDDNRRAMEAQEQMQQAQMQQINDHRVIIGVQNLTNHAGSSSLVNMMTRQMNGHGLNSIGVEMFKGDLIFYHDQALFSCYTKNDLEKLLQKFPNISAVFIDLNEFGDMDKFCDEILYLVEPSFIALTKLLKKNKNAFLDTREDKIVLVKSFINQNEIKAFELEANCKVFYNLPPLNDRNKNIQDINELLKKLGFNIPM